MYRKKGVGLPRQRLEGDRAGAGEAVALVCPGCPFPSWRCGSQR